MPRFFIFAGLVVACQFPTPHGDSDAGTGGSSSSSATGDAAPTATGIDLDPPGMSCHFDQQCPDRCLDGRCVEGCGPGLPCPGDMTCMGNACVPSLPAPAACAESWSVTPLVTVELPEGAAGRVGAADVDGDGVPELFAARGGLWLARQGALAPVKLAAGDMVGAFASNVGDVDGDGDLDLLPRAGEVVLFNDGSGQFTEEPGPDPALVDGALGDLDGDGRADVVGFMHTCPLDAPPETECAGETPARWLRGETDWQALWQGPVWHELGNVLVAPLLPGHAPVGVYETYQGAILLGTFTDESWQADQFGVSKNLRSSALVAVRRDGDDRAELLRFAPRNHWTWATRMRAGGGWAAAPDVWALPGEYARAAAGDLDLDGDDDVALAGGDVLLVLDREDAPTGHCVVALGEIAGAHDIAVADLDGVGPPELIVGMAPGLVAFTLQPPP